MCVFMHRDKLKVLKKHVKHSVFRICIFKTLKNVNVNRLKMCIKIITNTSTFNT